METTRQTILGILRRRQATVGDLAKELGLAAATIRRHMDILSRDGHVDVEQVRRKTGRPHYLFSLSEKGEDQFPKHYVGITNRLIAEIVALSKDETAGRGGRELADLVFDKMAHRLARRVAPHIRGSTLKERVRTTTEALAEEGITFDVEETERGTVLLGHGCPCPRAGESNGQVCAHDQRLLSMLLGADVSSVDSEARANNAYCAYLVQPRSGGEESAS